jgi:phage FluMu protein Com
MQTNLAPPLEVWRCFGCSRILAKLRLAPGSVVEVKCRSCSRLSTLETPNWKSATLPASS